MSTVYDFQGQLLASDGIAGGKDIPALLLVVIPNATKVRKATNDEDRNGIDYWVTLSSGREVGVDLKTRKVDFLKKYGKDDLALEIWSVLNKKIGWTRDPKKHTDFILFLWKDTMRYALFSFLQLSYVFTKNLAQWAEAYEHDTQNSTGAYNSHWQSECVYVPRDIVIQAIENAFYGSPTCTIAQVSAQIKKSRRLKSPISVSQVSLWEATA